MFVGKATLATLEKNTWKVLHSGKFRPYQLRIRPDWRDLPETNALAYYEHSKIMALNFYNIAPWLNVIKIYIGDFRKFVVS